MKVDGVHRRTIWPEPDGTVGIIDQNRLPFDFSIMNLTTLEDAAEAIRSMHVRGAGLIGATAAYGMYLAVRNDAPENEIGLTRCLENAASVLVSTRPTASNLAWAVDLMRERLTTSGRSTFVESTLDKSTDLIARAAEIAGRIADFDAEACRRIGTFGAKIVREIAAKKGGDPVRILTHCNAGWLAFVDYGSATAPVYLAHDEGIPVHVWVDETRPRNQGARLTAWELGQHGVSHTLIPDNAGGHLMQHGMVDMVIVGTDRVTRRGDVANKIGTYLKALAAADNGVPFYVALPTSTIDLDIDDGVAAIPIEERSSDEVAYMTGRTRGGSIETVRICPESTPAANYGFDVTPARLITGLITELGICDANSESIRRLVSASERSNL